MEARICQGIKNIEGNSDFLSPNYENYKIYYFYVYISQFSFLYKKITITFYSPILTFLFLCHVILNLYLRYNFLDLL